MYYRRRQIVLTSDGQGRSCNVVWWLIGSANHSPESSGYGSQCCDIFLFLGKLLVKKLQLLNILYNYINVITLCRVRLYYIILMCNMFIMFLKYGKQLKYGSQKLGQNSGLRLEKTENDG